LLIASRSRHCAASEEFDEFLVRHDSFFVGVEGAPLS
jgi:hypothetical protein